MAQMSRRMQASSGRFRAGRPATGWNIDARLSQQLGLKRRGEPGVWQLACANLPFHNAPLPISTSEVAHPIQPPNECYCCSAATLSSGGIPRSHQLSKPPYNRANFPRYPHSIETPIG
ncbi:hypothetical protein BDQ94DRAFT_67587 [Aspergillus welwitschiae]|uniref:Uncharacterized protein n=1 Tax=Aspergillus welwitschiae TaxID=1341132 RepID=A0A3F3PUE5_9EURO|nr:hypothetical protein BDQ94DRAFT_67587 [Aspergillus welwitschiae]RDH30495.1 hypothetical protein BDQ94DRAFT_67587 [Aspergillus welwitschiae]